MADGSFSSEAYIEPSVLEGWRSSMSTINGNCIIELDSFKSHSANLSNSWRGYAAEGYSQTFDSFIDVIKSKHEDMKDLDAFLAEVVLTMENQ